MATSKQKGDRGEQLAVEWMLGQGWQVLVRNARTAYGELDAIALDPSGMLVFVEVKACWSARRGLPESRVGIAKQKHLRNSAACWLAENPHWEERYMRFDVIAIDRTGMELVVRHFADAFVPDGLFAGGSAKFGSQSWNVSSSTPSPRSQGWSAKRPKS